MSDYLAVIMLPGGSSWGRDADKETAIKKAIKRVRDWRDLYQVSDKEVTVNVTDVEGYDDIHWNDLGEWYADGKLFKPVFEKIKRRTPKWK